jgi:acyl carrier protein
MSIKEQVLTGLKDKLALSSIDENSRLQDLGIDSLDVVEYLLEIEERYGIEFPPEEMADLKTINDLIVLIENKTSK